MPKAGGTLTGVLTLAADPTLSMQAATKHYVDAQAAVSLPISGGTLTGPLSLPSSPTQPLQAAPKQYVDGQVSSALPIAGGTLTGALTLVGDPTSVLQAATKRYVDSASGSNTGVINVRSAPYNAQLNGVTDDTAAFTAAYQAAAAGSVIHVPNGVTVLQPPPSWGVPLTKRVKWIVDGTSLPDGTPLADTIPGGVSPASNYLPGIVVGNSSASVEVSQNGSQPTDFAVAHSSYIVNHSGGPTGGAVIANTRNDTIIYNSPGNFVWGGVDRLLWCGSQTPSGAPAAEHVGRYVQTIRQNVGLNSSGKALPQPNLWAACLEYRDTTGQPSSMAASSIAVEMDWFGNGPDDGGMRQIQSLVIGQHSTSGAPVEVSTIIGVYLDAGCTGQAYRVFNVNVPFSTSVLDTTGAQQMAGAAAIRMAAGHAIAFEPTNTCQLAYDSVTNTLRWNQGALSYPVGKGIAVGWQTVYASSATLPNYVSGNIVFLIGGSPYAITLVHVISAMEACDAYKPWHDKQTHKTFIRPDSGKCLHYYFYFQDATFGLVYLRVPTWAPFRLQFYCNGHSWLARKLSAKGIGYTMADNAFVHIDDWALAQALADTLRLTSCTARWIGMPGCIARYLMCSGSPIIGA